jgi:GT2 family glycosyltransferase
VTEGFDASVVVPSRDRSVLLRRCLEALADQEGDRTFEVIVVDDGSAQAIGKTFLEGLGNARILRLHGVGPAAARNAGWRAARSDVVLFTDDDALPSRCWVDAICREFEDQPRLVGVEAPVVTDPFDRLYEHSVSVSEPGSGLTCNVAYRRSALERVGGFHEGFPFAHCEDIDLAHRMRRLGPVGFARRATVRHDPRIVSARSLIGRGRWAQSEMLLHARHPEKYPGRTGGWLRLFPVYSWARYWLVVAWQQRRRLLREPRRLVRLTAVGAGNVAVTAVAVMTWRQPRQTAGLDGDEG